MPLKIVSEKEKSRLFNDIVTQLNYDPDKIKVLDMDKERTLNIDGISSVTVEPYDIALKVAKEYEKRLHAMGMVDCVDIVKYATLLIQKEEYVRRCLEAKFPWILIDEYQDLGKPLHEMVLSLFHKTNIKIFAVGDPDQSIYG
ncbi:UvrD-helicase domain-containing protein [Bacillus methanolicus]|uniref:UvrD-helicase domain-containing protein n=1 Tax=Bacillus methanolicus TaxID=1471 RepID=UPI00200C8423|nr:UvrD-helicase domain-containing protein [Bacillus methanolicus]